MGISGLTAGKKFHSAGPVVLIFLPAPASHFPERKVSLTMTVNKRTMNDDPLPLTHLNAKTALSGPMFGNVARLLNDRHVAVVEGWQVHDVLSDRQRGVS